MGINAEREITSHGLAINCNTDMKWFGNIVPCGIVDKGTFLHLKLTSADTRVHGLFRESNTIIALDNLWYNVWYYTV